MSYLGNALLFDNMSVLKLLHVFFYLYIFWQVENSQFYNVCGNKSSWFLGMGSFMLCSVCPEVSLNQSLIYKSLMLEPML